jgi:hypothetical protein
MCIFMDIINSPYIQGALSFGSGSTYIYISLKSNCLVLFNYTNQRRGQEELAGLCLGQCIARG